MVKTAGDLVKDSRFRTGICPGMVYIVDQKPRNPYPSRFSGVCALAVSAITAIDQTTRY